MSTLAITVPQSAGSLVVQGQGTPQVIHVTTPGTPTIVQLGSLSSAVYQQITQAVSASAASAATATGAAATATSEAGVATAAAGTATAEAQAAAASAAASANAYSAIANGTATSAGTLTGAEIAPVSRGLGLLQTTLSNIADFVLGQLTFANYTALRSYNGIRTFAVITGAGIGGEFVRLSSAAGLSDNGGTIIFDAAGRAWQRLYVGPVYLAWFGADLTGTNDSTAAFLSAVNWCYTVKARLLLNGGVSSSAKLLLNNGEMLLPNWFDIYAERDVTVTFASAVDRGWVSKTPTYSKVQGVIFNSTGQVNQYLCFGQDLANNYYAGTTEIDIKNNIFNWANATSAMVNAARNGGIYINQCSQVRIDANEWYWSWRQQAGYNASNYGGNNLVHLVYIDNIPANAGYVYFRNNVGNNIWTAVYFGNVNEVFCDDNDFRTTADTTFFDRCTGGVTYRKRFRRNTFVNIGKTPIKALDTNNLTGKGHYAWVEDNYIENWGLYLTSGAINCANYFDYGNTNVYINASPANKANGFVCRNNTIIETSAQSCGIPYQLINLNNPILCDRVINTNSPATWLSFQYLFQFCIKPQLRGGFYKTNSAWGLYQCNGALLSEPDFEMMGPFYVSGCAGMIQWNGGQILNQDASMATHQVYGITSNGTSLPAALQVNGLSIVVPISQQDGNATTNVNIFGGFAAGVLNADNIIVNFNNGSYIFKTTGGNLRHAQYYAEVKGGSFLDATNNQLDIAMSVTRSNFLGANLVTPTSNP